MASLFYIKFVIHPIFRPVILNFVVSSWHLFSLVPCKVKSSIFKKKHCFTSKFRVTSMFSQYVNKTNWIFASCTEWSNIRHLDMLFRFSDKISFFQILIRRRRIWKMLYLITKNSVSFSLCKTISSRCVWMLLIFWMSFPKKIWKMYMMPKNVFLLRVFFWSFYSDYIVTVYPYACTMLASEYNLWKIAAILHQIHACFG